MRRWWAASRSGHFVVAAGDGSMGHPAHVRSAPTGPAACHVAGPISAPAPISGPKRIVFDLDQCRELAWKTAAPIAISSVSARHRGAAAGKGREMSPFSLLL